MKREYKKISESRLAERPLIVLEAEIRKWGEVWYVEFQMLVGHVEISPSLDSAAQGKDIEKQKQSKKKKKSRVMNTLKDILKRYSNLYFKIIIYAFAP